MILAKGSKELQNHRWGKKLSLKQAVLAKCNECCGCYDDGKADCGIPGCPLYGYMPYGKAWQNRVKDPKQVERAKKRFRKAEK